MPDTPPEATGSRILRWAGEVAEPLVAVVAGLGLAVAGLTGALTGDKLTAATLLVLSVVALSLLRERTLRVSAKHAINALGSRIDATTDAVNAIQTGNPYTVLSHETTWDIVEPDGSLVVATRVKKLRIDQNKVVSLYDIAEGEGTREIAYSPGEAVASFFGEGHWLTLVSLGRVYYRGEHFDFTVKRTARDAFVRKHEAINVLTRDRTEHLRLTVKWPKDTPPTAVGLSRATPSEEWRTEDVTHLLEHDEDGRPFYRVTIRDPEKGGIVTIEWDWNPRCLPLTELTGGS